MFFPISFLYLKVLFLTNLQVVEVLWIKLLQYTGIAG